MNSLSAKVGVLIKLHPNHAVYNVGCKTLGGLQFYLDELVLPVTAEELPVVLKEDYSKGITPIVVVGKNILDKTTPNIDLKEYRVKELNRFWAVIIPVSAAP